jgi:hypothetical protein
MSTYADGMLSFFDSDKFTSIFFAVNSIRLGLEAKTPIGKIAYMTPKELNKITNCFFNDSRVDSEWTRPRLRGVRKCIAAFRARATSVWRI